MTPPSLNCYSSERSSQFEREIIWYLAANFLLLNFRSALALLFLFSSLLSKGQQYVDVLSLSYGLSPETGFENEDGTSRINHADINLTLPIPINDRTNLIIGFTGILNRLRLDPAATEHNTLYNINSPIGINRIYANGWSGTHVLMPRLSSSFENSRLGFQLGTAHLLQKNYSPARSFTFGLYMNTEEQGLLLVPLLGYYYLSPDESWEFNLLLPARADINHGLSPGLRIGLTYDGLGSSYAIDSEQFGKAYVQRISNELATYFRVDLSKSFLLAFRAGYSFFRSYRVYDSEDRVNISIGNIFFKDPRSILNTSIKDGFLFKVRLIYRFHLRALSEEALLKPQKLN